MALIYLVAGEVSGDLHGAELISALRERGGHRFAGWGGVRMAQAGGTRDWVEKAGVMGVWDVLKQYPWFRARFHETLAEIERLQPEVLVLIDYPGFNLRLAKAVRARCPQVRILQYVCPQVWAWKQSRIPKMARWLDQVVCLFPFEVEVLARGGCPGVCLGHPIVDELAAKREDLAREKNLIGLFPGSRRREVERLFPVMREAARELRQRHPDWLFEVPAISPALAETMMLMRGEDDFITIKVGSSQALMQRATCAVMASGTATLEAAYFGLPYCLVYKVAPLTWEIGKRVVKVAHIGIANILAGREVVPEYLQEELSAPRLVEWIEGQMEDEAARERLSQELLAVAARLGDGGVHQRVAEEVLKLIEHKTQ
ncbi:lipid-A-disaccharide synthase [Roseibacillus ishigakijimensis]|uniref:Lipid-A-disaccharide synthase n=1 Tax=Roseibacillus ishigakijimensis TaxID=454146 RepID=A0A934VHA3_9BACT|nr:lipid-A-disaccharide synthase [Roseibacillus ishigakijimensis]MBK1833718.1 lipid-A-disaccharide synthase [Roseibacillus ishigakijimensis]